MTIPVRLRLRRTKGFNLQALSRSVNGLPAINVARSSRWGNPFEVATDATPEERAEAVERFRCETVPTLDLAPLASKNLACYCRLDQVCHADVLLRLANN
jgi:hypothetical protein